MSGAVEVFLDETPGETRGAVLRDGRFTHLLIQRDTDIPQTRLGARSVGRVTEVNPGLRGAFVDLGADTPGFLSFGRHHRLTQGERLEVEVTAEPRGGKGATLRLIGPGEGTPRLLEVAPDVTAQLAEIAPDESPIMGLEALDAVLEAEDEAMARTHAFPAQGIDLAIERTRALIAVDIDHAPRAGRDPKQERAAANREGLRQAARLIALRNWGGLVVVDLVGDGQDAEAQTRTVRAAFAGQPQAVFGPISRFGLVQLSLPWRRTPIEERLSPANPQVRAQALVRQLRRRLLSDTTLPRVVARCAPEEAALAAPLALALGPRAVIRPDAAVAAGRGYIEES